MFDQLFKCPSAIARHSNAPYAEERRRYLAARSQQGNSHFTLVFDAQDLLWVARKLSVYPDLHQVTMEQVQALADDWKSRECACGRPLKTPLTQQRYLRLAVAWLRFFGSSSGARGAVPLSEATSGVLPMGSGGVRVERNHCRAV